MLNLAGKDKMFDKEFKHGGTKFYFGKELVTTENFKEIFYGEHFVDKFNWFIDNNDLTYEWINKFQDLASWRQLAFHYKFTEDFVREYWYWVVRDGGCRGCLSEYQIRNFSIDFIRECPWLWSWHHIKKYHLKYFGEKFTREFWYKMENIATDDYIGY